MKNSPSSASVQSDGLFAHAIYNVAYEKTF